MDVTDLVIAILMSTYAQKLGRNLFFGLCVAVAVFSIIYAVERLSGERTTQYRTRNFRNDLGYWFYYHSGVHDFVLGIVLFTFLENQLSFLRLPLDDLPTVLRYVIYWVVVDFIGYWYHRMAHANRYLWQLHTTHHSQEILTFPTGIRVHPLENVLGFAVRFLPLVALGKAPQVWLAIDFVLRMVPDALQHTEIAWRMGPLYRVLVSPTFHSFHHSVDPRYHDKNFGISLSVWDFLFGTAVDEKQRARVYGVTGVHMPSWRSQLLTPLNNIYAMARAAEPRAMGGRGPAVRAERGGEQTAPVAPR